MKQRRTLEDFQADLKAKRPKSWRDVIKVHPAADLFPMMSADELKVLGEDIKRNGLTSRVAVIDDGGGPVLLDGRNRLDAMELAGFEIVTEEVAKLACCQHHISGFDPFAYVISANIHRRHLTAEQKRDLIAKVIAAQPDKSDRQIAKMVKADHKTVGKARRQGEDVGTIPHVETRTDTRGRKQPAKKPAQPPVTPANAETNADDDGNGYGVAPLAEIRRNILDTIDQHAAVVRAYKKVLRASSPNEEMKEEVSNAIGVLITVWQSLQRALRGEKTNDGGKR
jgi:hypothetical protein